MHDNWDKVLFLFLGWLLATLSPIIADAIRKRREVKETRNALLAELSELKYRLAIVCYRIESDFGEVKRQLLQWLQPIVIEYRGPLQDETIAKMIEAQLKFTDAQLGTLAQAKGKKSGHALLLKRYPAPFLESRLKTIAWLPTKVQALMLEIHTQIGVLEAELENVQYNVRLTFDSGMSEENRLLVEGNLNSGYRNYAKVSTTIVERISELEQAW